MKRLNSSSIYIGKDSESLKRWKLGNASILNAAYFVVFSQILIFPPDIREAVPLDYLNNLLQMVPEKDVSKILSGLSRNKVIVFAIKQPTEITNYIGFFVKGGKLEKYQGKYLLNNIERLQPLVVSRADKKFLLSVLQEKNWILTKRKYLLPVVGQ